MTGGCVYGSEPASYCSKDTCGEALKIEVPSEQKGDMNHIDVDGPHGQLR